MRRTWTFQLDEQVHTVVLDHSWITSSRRIELNGLEIVRVPPALKLDLGSRHKFTIGRHQIEVIIHTTSASVAYDLEINGQSIRTGLFKPTNATLLRAAAQPDSSANTLLRASMGQSGETTNGDQQLLRAGQEPKMEEERS